MDRITTTLEALGLLSPRDRADVERRARAGEEPTRALRIYLNEEELGWASRMALQDYSSAELAALRRDWILVRICRGEQLFPKGAEDLPRLLLERWSGREGATLRELVTRRNLDGRFLTRAEDCLRDGRVLVCDRCLGVRRGGDSPCCTPEPSVASMPDEATLLELARSFPRPSPPGLALSLDDLERALLKTLDELF